MEKGFVRFLQRYKPDQLEFIARLLQESIETSFLELGGRVAEQAFAVDSPSTTLPTSD